MRTSYLSFVQFYLLVLVGTIGLPLRMPISGFFEWVLLGQLAICILLASRIRFLSQEGETIYAYDVFGFKRVFKRSDLHQVVRLRYQICYFTLKNGKSIFFMQGMIPTMRDVFWGEKNSNLVRLFNEMKSDNVE